MSEQIHIRGMHGLGDNLHQRSVIRQLMDQGHTLWLETPWPSVYHDLVGERLHLVNKASSLRTQAKNARREAGKYSRRRIPSEARRLQVSYAPDLVRKHGSVLRAMSAACAVEPGDFTLPIPQQWHERAQRWLAQWKPDKPLLIYRPLIERTEWGGCRSRNPDHDSYAALVESVQDQFFVLSVADLQPGKEWIVGRQIKPDAECHRGELEFETLAALTAQAAMVISSPGFAVILAQAGGTPACCVFGGYESARSFAYGAAFAPYLGIEPIKPCECFSHSHTCQKAIDMPKALEQLRSFTDEATAHSAIAA